MDQIQVEGLRIAFEQAGQGPPLVLLHGGLSDSREWRRQLDELSDGFTVVAWDAPGCGRSSDPPETFRLPEYADCLAAFIHALGLGRPHVLGLSFGAGLALEFYRRHTTVPMTLVLASAYAGWAGSLPPDVVEQRLQRALPEAELPPETFAQGYLDSLLTESVPAEFAEELLQIMSDVRPTGMHVMAHAFAEADLRDVLPRIDVPTLLLYGDADDLPGFWSLLKRGISGIYHSVSAKYLQDYLNEYAYRYNHRDDPKGMFQGLLANLAHVRLADRRLASGKPS